MPITVVCPGCAHELKVPDTGAGKRVRCPRCQTIANIPSAKPAEFTSIEEEIDLVLAVSDPLPPPSAPAPEPPRPKTRRAAIRRSAPAKIPIVPLVIVLAILVVGGAVAGGYYLFFRNPAPELLEELPPGTMAYWMTKEMLEMQTTAEMRDKGPSYTGMREMAIVMSLEEKKFFMVTLLKGEFDVAKVKAEFTEQGYVETETDGHTLLLQGASAVSISRSRVIQGSKDSVLETLRVREGRATSFLDSLTPEERSVVRKVPPGQMFGIFRSRQTSYSKKDDDSVLSVGRGLGFSITGTSGAAYSAVKDGPNHAVVSVALSCKDRDEADRVEKLLAKKQEGITILSMSRSGLMIEVKARVKLEKPGP